jgi:hypothetical protein
MRRASKKREGKTMRTAECRAMRTLGAWMLTLVLSPAAWGACPATVTSSEAMTGSLKIEQDLTSGSDETTDRQHLAAKSPEHKVFWDDYNDRWCAILWSKGSQKFEIFCPDYDWPDEWVSTEVSVHHSDETDPKKRYLRRFDVVEGCSDSNGMYLYVLSHQFATKVGACDSPKCPIYLFLFRITSGEISIVSPVSGEWPIAVNDDLQVEVATLTFVEDNPYVVWAQPDGTGVVKVASHMVTGQDCYCSPEGDVLRVLEISDGGVILA